MAELRSCDVCGNVIRERVYELRRRDLRGLEEIGVPADGDYCSWPCIAYRVERGDYHVRVGGIRDNDRRRIAERLVALAERIDPDLPDALRDRLALRGLEEADPDLEYDPATGRTNAPKGERA
jgi:hypothetical protein